MAQRTLRHGSDVEEALTDALVRMREGILGNDLIGGSGLWSDRGNWIIFRWRNLVDINNKNLTTDVNCIHPWNLFIHKTSIYLLVTIEICYTFLLNGIFKEHQKKSHHCVLSCIRQRAQNRRRYEYDSDDAASETSSVCSERSYRSIGQTSEVRTFSQWKYIWFCSF